MRDGIRKARDSCDIVTVAAVWPVSAQIAPLPIPEIEHSATRTRVGAAPTASRAPAVLGGLIVATYAAVLATFACSSATGL